MTAAFHLCAEQASSINFEVADTLQAHQNFKRADSLARLPIIPKNENALDYLKKATDLYDKVGAWQRHVAVNTQLGQLLSRKEEYKQAIMVLEEAVNVARAHLKGENRIKLANAYNQLGIVYRRKGDYEKSLNLHHKALEIQQNISGKNDVSLSSTHYNIGNVYYAMGEYESSLKSNQKALTIQQQTLAENDPKIAATYSNIGLISLKLGAYANAIEAYNKVLQVQKQIYTDRHPKAAKIASTHTSLALAHKKQKSYDQALQASNNALDVLQRTFESRHPDFSVNYNIIGDIYLVKEDYVMAQEYYERALNARKNVLSNRHPKVVESYLKMAGLYREQKDFDKALRYCQKSLLAAVKDFEDMKITANPPLKGIISEVYLLDALQTKAEILEENYLAKKDISHLKNALRTYRLAGSLIGVIGKLHIAIDEDKPFTLKKAMSGFQGGVRTATMIQEEEGTEGSLQIAFELMEKSKQASLREALRTSKLSKLVNMDSLLLEQEHNVKIDLNYNKEKYLAEQQKGDAADVAKMKKFERALASLNEERDSLELLFQEKYPKYYSLKYDTAVFSLTQIQQQLAVSLPKTAIIQYFVGNQDAYVFSITKDEQYLMRFPLAFDNALAAFYDAVTNYTLITSKPDEAYTLYVKNAHELYKQIAAKPLATLAGKNIEQLLVIPEKELTYVPFEALLTKAASSDVDYRALNYLMNAYSVTYGFSTTDLMKNIGQKRLHKTNYVGFGTSYDIEQIAVDADADVSRISRAINANLAGAEKEVKTITDIMGGTQFIGARAVEKSFKQQAANYGLVHLVLHTLVNDDKVMNSKILFVKQNMAEEDGYLNVSELYNMELPINLLVMSAVRSSNKKEISKGQNKRFGAGLQQLVKALEYAGCQSIVSTLWRSEDEAALNLMSNFYRQLNDGNGVASSLHAAKKRFLNQRNQLRAHPYFWAAPLSIGNPTPVKGGSNWLVWLGIGLLALVAGGSGWYVWKGREEKM